MNIRHSNCINWCMPLIIILISTKLTFAIKLWIINPKLIYSKHTFIQIESDGSKYKQLFWYGFNTLQHFYFLPRIFCRFIEVSRNSHLKIAWAILQYNRYIYRFSISFILLFENVYEHCTKWVYIKESKRIAWYMYTFCIYTFR